MDKKVYQELLAIFGNELSESHAVLTGELLAIEHSADAALTTHLDTLFRTAHNIKGAAASVDLQDIVTLAHELEDTFSHWRETHNKPSTTEINRCLEQTDKILSLYQKKGDDQTAGDEILKISAMRVEQANVKADEFVTYQLRFENLLDRLKLIRAIDNQAVAKSLANLAEDFTSVIGEFSRGLLLLQSDLREMRMIPVKTILDPLKRTARELAQTMHKQVRLVIQGDDIELDKIICDAIKDPLQHLLRNALDHGIEAPEKRLAAKKDEIGTILIKVFQDAGKIKIAFTDDGGGIDLQIIKQLAIKRNLITEQDAAALTEPELLQFMTRPGFSTREAVSEISGRGVGLDVVSENLQKIKGKLEISSKLGKGTTFTLSLPLTLATTRGLFVRVAQHIYMIPSLNITALHEIKQSDIKPLETDHVALIGQRSIPVRRLSDVFSLEATDHPDAVWLGIELSDPQQTYILLVEKFEDEHDCVVKPMVHPFDQIDVFMGITLTGADELVPVLNPKALLTLSQKFQGHLHSLATPKARAAEQEEVAKRILVVDDSITTRSLASNALKARGYHVDTMVDGKQAWQQLKQERYDAVITDIEMPHMDGYELTALIKADDQLKELPVIIVSSCESDEEKQRGIKAGASSYLVKSQFNTHSLIQRLEELL